MQQNSENIQQNPENIKQNPTSNEGMRRVFLGEGKIAVRFRNINIALFTVAFIFMAIAMMTAFNSIIRHVSTGYAERYATTSANALSAHIIREIDILAKAANSGAVIAWLADEDNDDKKIRAFEEMSGIIGELYSNNLYIGVEKSRHEYRIEENFSPADIRPLNTLSEDNLLDAWYFDAIASDNAYLLSVGIDQVLDRKRVWLNYKVVRDGIPIGVICTGLDFSHVAEELFSQYDSSIRGLVIDKDGIIYMDSDLLNDENFLQYIFEVSINDVFSDPVILNALKSHLDSIETYFDYTYETIIIKRSISPHLYMTIAPIRYTNSSSVILYDSSSSFSMSLFFPVFTIMLVLLVAFALATSVISYRLIFMPLEHLIRSLSLLKENSKEPIYGVGRDDEIGDLSNTIQDLFTKANFDALTGIHNRRFMENNLYNVMEYLSRSKGSLSVLMVDVDFFKMYNDTYGHEQGDVCLRAIAQTLSKGATRTHDFAARYGGEEFVVVLPHTDEDGARLIAERLLEDVRALNMPHAKNSAADCVTVSIGVTTGSVMYTQSWSEYLKRADEALYMSKQNGRNRQTYLDYP